jgi:hypothetical protein
MSDLEKRLKEICSELFSLDEDELVRSLPYFQSRLENYSAIEEWEEAVIIFFIINGLRIKSIQLPEKLAKLAKRMRLGAGGQTPAAKKGAAPENAAAGKKGLPDAAAGFQRQRPALTLVQPPRETQS